jgi:hypothetical protein
MHLMGKKKNLFQSLGTCTDKHAHINNRKYLGLSALLRKLIVLLDKLTGLLKHKKI